MKSLKDLSTKHYLIIGAVVLLAVLLVGGALLMQRSGGDPEATEESTQTSVVAGGSSGSAGGPAAATQPAVPQTDPVPLVDVGQPPERTLAFINADDFSADSEYFVTFVPYGTAGGSSELIIQVTESQPRGEIAKPFDFNGRNLLVDTTMLPTDSVTQGGTYTGVLRLVKEDSSLAEGGVLSPKLIEASPAE